MADLPTLEAAMALADQDCPLPSLAGPALKRLRAEFEAEREGRISLDERAQVEVRLLREHCRHAGIDPSGQDYHIALSARIDHLLAIEKAVTPLRFFPNKVTDSATLTALIAELRRREAVGRAKYGTDVDRADLNNAQWRQHLREELMDALLYSLAEQRTAPPMTSDDSLMETLLAMARPIKPACWCNACHPTTLTNMRMVACPTCGNKRYPHANDHRNACTGSNAVGQPGSSWEHVKPADSGESSC